MYRKIKTEKQIEQVSQLARSIWFPHFSPMIEPDALVSIFEDIQSVKAISNQIQSGYTYYFIYPGNKTRTDPIGYFAYILKPEKSELFLSKLYLISSARDCGYGKKVMEFLSEKARKNGCTSITLIVFRKNESALKAYKKMGFVRTETTKHYINKNLTVIDYTMKKKV